MQAAVMQISEWRLARHQAGVAQMTLGERVVRIPLVNATLGKVRFAGWWLVPHRGPQRVGAWALARVRALGIARLFVPESPGYARSRTRA